MKKMKKVTAAVSAALVLSASTVCAFAEKPAGFENENAALSAELVARYDSGAISADGGSMEIVVYNKANGYAYAVSGIKGAIAAINIGAAKKSDDVAKLSGTEFNVKELVSKADNLGGFVYGDITSIAVSPDKTKLAACIQHEDYSKNGAVAVFSFGENGKLVNPVLYNVGVQPDMVTFANDSTILTANEGEPREGYADGTVDPKGSVSVVDIANGAVKTVGFEKFTAYELIAKNIIIGKANGKILEPEFDLEPEYIAVSGNGEKAYVSLQEANAVAVLNVKKGEFENISSVGFEDYSKVAVDLKDDGEYKAETYENLVGARLPDAISIYEANGKIFVLTANEGDAREWGDYCNEIKDKKAIGSSIRVIDSECAAGLPDGKTVMFGGRSFSIFEVTADGLTEVFDSKNDFEILTAKYLPEFFNCSNNEIKIDGRSQKKGPEPETVAVGNINGREYAFIALERIGGIMIYDITEPASAQFVNYINSRDFTSEISGDVSPEGLYFAQADDGKKPMLIAANEVSGTVAVYELSAAGNAGTNNENPDTGVGLAIAPAITAAAVALTAVLKKRR